MNSEQVLAIIQARTGSTRLPGKVLQDIGGQTMLARVISRVQQAATINQIVVATSTEAGDDPIEEVCNGLSVPVFRGNEQDVLDRFYQAATAFHAQAVVRITADCPLIDPGLIDAVVTAFLAAQPDYASNILERRYPRGLDTEVITMAALSRAWREAKEPYQRVHVTPYFYQNAQLFRLLSVPNGTDLSHYRWTVDTPDDLEFVRLIYGRFANRNTITWQEVITLLQQEPALSALNQHIQQKALHEG